MHGEANVGRSRDTSEQRFAVEQILFSQENNWPALYYTGASPTPIDFRDITARIHSENCKIENPGKGADLLVHREKI